MPAPSNKVDEKRQNAKQQEDPIRSKEQRKGNGRAASTGSVMLARSPDTAGPPPADQHRPLLDRYEQPGRGAQRSAFLTSLQQSYGNQYVQRLVAGPSSGIEGSRPAANIIPSGGGRAMEAPVRNDMEGKFGTSFPNVRVHTDGAAGDAARSLGARAFTSSQDIYFSRGSYQPETPTGKGLLAHELAHTIQQRGNSPGPQRAVDISPPDDPLEHQADRAADAALSGARTGALPPIGNAQVMRSGVTVIQRQPAAASSHIPAGPAGAAAGMQEASVEGGRDAERTGEPRKKNFWDLGDLGEEIFAKLVDSELLQIIRKGPAAWLMEQITSGIETIVSTLTAPVRAVAGVAASLNGHFANLLDWMRDAAAKIAKGDCKPISEAVQKIEEVIEGLASPVIEKIKELAGRVKGFFGDLWDNFGMPAWDFLKKVGGAVWEKIQQFGQWIWDKTAPLRVLGKKAWTWIKNKLGIGEGPEGQDGILQWVKGKADHVWTTYVKPFIEKYKKPLMAVAGVLALLSPAGPVIAVGAAVGGLIAGIRWLRQNMGQKDAVVEQRGILERTIIPGIQKAVGSVTAAFSKAAAFITGKLNEVVGGLSEAVTAFAGSIFRFAAGAIQWIVDQFQALVNWASEKLAALAEWVRAGLESLKEFLQPVLDVLGEVGEVYLDILKLPFLIAGKVWNLIPACIRNPFVDFLINQVLKRIPIVKDVIEMLPGIWSKVKATGLMLIRKVFKEGDLMGAAFEIFKLVLDALQIPLELITGIISKAATARDVILKDPLGFLGNMLSAIKQGFIQFGERIWEHLKDSIVNWMRGVIESAGLKPPADLSLSSVMEFILQVLGLSVDKVLERLEKKLDKETYQKIRKALSTIAKIWDWINTALNEGPQGVWNRLKEQIGDLWGTLLDGAIGWVTGKVTKIALPRITAALGTAPVGAVVEAIIFLYKAIQTAAQYAKRILELVSSVLDGVIDIAHGAIDNAAKIVEASLGRALTVVIGFLANYLGFGDLGKKLKEIVESIQEKVTKAIDWVIDKAVAAGKAIIGAITKAAKGVAQWWKASKPVVSTDGEKHSLYLKGEGADAKLIIESDPTDYRTFVSKLKTKKDKEPALKLAKTTDEAIAAAAKTDAPADTGEKVEKSLEALAAATVPLLDGAADKSTPPVFGPQVGGFGSSATVLKLTDKHDKGGEPTVADNDRWKFLKQRLDGKGTYYVRGHLLNHNLGGPGNTWDNLTPLTQFANNRAGDSMLKTFEKPIKDAVEADEAINFAVTVTYGRNHPLASQVAEYKDSGDPEDEKIGKIIEAEEYVPLSLRCKGSRIDAKGKIGSVVAEETVENIIQDRIEDYFMTGKKKKKLNINKASDLELQELYGIDKATAAAIAAGASKKPYKSAEDVMKAGNLTEKQWKAARETPRLRVVVE